MESFNVTCRLHGSPKNQATNTMSPLHRLQSLDLMDDIPLTYCKETNTNSPILTTPIIEHNKIMTPRRQANHHQLHALNDDLSSNTTTNHKNKSYGGGGSGAGAGAAGCTASACDSINGANFVGSSTYNCDGVFGTTSSSSNSANAHHHHQKQSSSASHSHHTLHRSFSQQEQPKLDDRCGLRHRWQACPELHKAMDGVNYIADHTRKEEESTKVNYYLNPHIAHTFISISIRCFWIHIPIQFAFKQPMWNAQKITQFQNDFNQWSVGHVPFDSKIHASKSISRCSNRFQSFSIFFMFCTRFFFSIRILEHINSALYYNFLRSILFNIFFYVGNDSK